MLPGVASLITQPMMMSMSWLEKKGIVLTTHRGKKKEGFVGRNRVWVIVMAVLKLHSDVNTAKLIE